MAGDLSFPWNILWSDEVHFYLNGTVNTQISSTWAKENPLMPTEIPLHSPKVNVSVDLRQHLSLSHSSLKK